MKEVKLETVLNVFDGFEELPKQVQNLMTHAFEARRTAYSPYSHFSVGAAILLENGEIVTGSNQENASYPSGLCAERTAIFYAGAKYPNIKMITMALTAGPDRVESMNPIPPCGACRQSISEYEIKQNSPIEIYFMGVTGKIIKSNSMSNLLPFVFERSML